MVLFFIGGKLFSAKIKFPQLLLHKAELLIELAQVLISVFIIVDSTAIATSRFLILLRGFIVRHFSPACWRLWLYDGI